MTETILNLLQTSGALRQGHFLLSAGSHSDAYVQCALLLEEPRRASRVGEMLAAKLAPFEIDSIVSPALGGLIIGYEGARALDVPFRFAERVQGRMELRRGFVVRTGERIAIIEDVVTTGKSTNEVADLLSVLGAEIGAIGSILDRTGEESPFRAPFESLLRLDLPVFDPDSCPLCAAGTPIDKPGSRTSS